MSPPSPPTLNPSTAASLLPLFQPTRILNQDQGGRRLVLLGTISSHPAVLLLERAALPSALADATALHASLSDVAALGANDIYAWYLASTPAAPTLPDVKLNLIYPSTEAHVRKYSKQTTRLVTETAGVYAEWVRPYIERCRSGGRLDWVYNILEGKAEQEDVIVRESRDLGRDEEGFVLLPDMNWDRRTVGSLRILGLVERRDLWSLRDLKKKDVAWLKEVHGKMVGAVEKMYGVDGDMLKVYVHYHPTYYHFHMHLVSTELEPNQTQAVGKAFSLPNLIAQLETMAGGPETGMAGVDITYTLGEISPLWIDVFRELKKTGRDRRPDEGDKERDAS